ncbi:RHS repeat-associated core domain-containing protein [Pseudomonas sp. NPDC089547]|uniref:RHS repeat-associated core domain-containing protein n=1 Tax=Pseudomonas sp. NPDC089547 TaxID=3390652 RepID=UPI003D03E69C
MFVFYQSDRPASIVSQSPTIRIINDDHQALAIQRDRDSSAELIASDSTHSSVAMSDRHVMQALSHSAFGYYHSTSKLLIAFNGERRDTVTGMYGLGAGYRWYSTEMMRFLSPDSSSPFGEGGISAYAYVRNDPVNLIDPLGRAAQLPSVFFGKKFNYIKSMKRLKSFDQEYGIYRSGGGLFKKPSLVIHSHGGTDALQVGAKQLTAKGFTDWLGNNGIKTSDYQKATFVTCLTGLSSSGRPTFAQQFADLNRMKVDAYAGIIYSSITEYPRSGKFILGVLSEPFPGLFPDPHPNFTKFPRVYSETRFQPQKAKKIRENH